MQLSRCERGFLSLKFKHLKLNRQIKKTKSVNRFRFFYTRSEINPNWSDGINSVSTKSRFPYSLKGGDPAAPSDTATLLRLHPSHWSYLRRLPPCG